MEKITIAAKKKKRKIIKITAIIVDMIKSKVPLPWTTSKAEVIIKSEILLVNLIMMMTMKIKMI